MSEEQKSLDRRTLLKENLSSATVAGTLFLGSLLYFTGNQFFDAKAEALGLAGNPGEPSLHKAMAVGASVLMTGQYLTYAAAVAAILLLLVQFSHRRDRPSVGHGEQDDFSDLSGDLAKRLDDLKRKADSFPEGSAEREAQNAQIRAIIGRLRLAVEVGHMRSELRATSSAWPRATAALAFACGVPLLIILVLIAGHIEGQKAAGDLKNALALHCFHCVVYRGEKEAVLGLPALQTNDGLFVLHEDGLSYFKNEGLIIGEKPTPTGDKVKQLPSMGQPRAAAPAVPGQPSVKPLTPRTSPAPTSR